LNKMTNKGGRLAGTSDILASRLQRQTVLEVVVLSLPE